MTKPQAIRRGAGGFTLIEVVLAMGITAIVLLVLFAALRLGHRSQARGEREHELDQHVRVITDRVSWLIRGAYPFLTKEDEGDTEEVLMFKGEGESMGFVTTSTDPYSDSGLDSAGLKWVELFADGDGLKMKERVFFLSEYPADSREFVIDGAVSDISFEYLDMGGEEEAKPGGALEEEIIEGEGEWKDEWDSTEDLYLPSAVRVRVKVKAGEGEEELEMELPEVIARVRAGGKAIGAKKKEAGRL